MIENYTIPTYAIPYLEYGDISDLTEQDKEEIDKFLERTYIEGKNRLFNYSENEFYSNYPEFGLPGNCCELTIKYM